MDKECLYCKMEENGDFPDDHPDLFAMRLGKVFGYEISTYGYVGNGILYIGTNFGVDSGPVLEKKIKYCPMCGRKLSRR